ncbi:SOS response-associated peptidase [Phaeobacter sp. B1627]|nr:SOS response-associated peptidase [Phaeobacter sp. B1627]
MCGRFVDPNLRGTELDFSELKIDPIPRRFNVKPTDPALILTAGPQKALWARWGLIPSWFKGSDPREWKATTFNARIEEAKDKPTYGAAWRRGRCLIPVGGFYEWSGPKAHRQPYFFASPGNEANLYFAGLISVWNDMSTCTIMTRAANAAMSGLHHRMPVVLDPSEREAWMSGSMDTNLGASAVLHNHPVRRFRAADDGPELIERE